MKNGILSLHVFEILDTIREHNRISNTELAEKSGLKYPARLSELRKMARIQREGGDPFTVGRAFSIKKCIAILSTLKDLLGGATLNKELLKLLENAQSRKERNIIMLLGLTDRQDESLEIFLKTLLETSEDPK